MSSFINEDSENFEHFSSKDFTPIREDAFEKTPKEKIKLIEPHFESILEILGLDLTDDSLRNTPKRVAKMFVNEIFGGLLPENKPKVSTFSNSYSYNKILLEKDISVFSTCEHHFLPIIGKAHVAYISTGKIIGLSKINRIVNYYSKRPQVQERLTIQIVKALKNALETPHVACVIDAKHLCVHSRGIQDTDSTTLTMELSGMFQTDIQTRNEFFNLLNLSKK